MVWKFQFRKPLDPVELELKMGKSILQGFLAGNQDFDCGQIFKDGIPQVDVKNSEG